MRAFTTTLALALGFLVSSSQAAVVNLADTANGFGLQPVIALNQGTAAGITDEAGHRAALVQRLHQFDQRAGGHLCEEHPHPLDGVLVDRADPRRDQERPQELLQVSIDVGDRIADVVESHVELQTAESMMHQQGVEKELAGPVQQSGGLVGAEAEWK